MPTIRFPAGVDLRDVRNEPKNWFHDAGECGNLLYRVKDGILMTAEGDFLFSFDAASEFAKSAG